MDNPLNYLLFKTKKTQFHPEESMMRDRIYISCCPIDIIMNRGGK